MTDPAQVALPILIKIRTPHDAPVRGAAVVVTGGGVQIHCNEDPEQPGVYRLLLPRVGDYHLAVQRTADDGGFDHRTLRSSLFYVRPNPPLLQRLSSPAKEGSRIKGVQPLPHGFQVDVVLDYLWFTPIGTPPTLGNQLDLLINGEEGWGAVADAIETGRESVHVTTWIYQPTTELRRPDPLAEPRDRAANTVHALLEDRARAGVQVRLLVWDAPVLQLPPEVQKVGADPSDNFEVLEQENPAEIDLFGGPLKFLNTVLGDFKVGSYHQKTVIVDGEIGFCGGMNLKENDWDTRKHALFDPKRAKFTRPRTFREQILHHLVEPDHPPRHDYIARMRGPSVRHLDQNFQERWNWLIDHDRTEGRPATPIDRLPDPPPVGRTQVQVVRTMPDPWNERGILDTHIRAIEKARRLIFIEDQYFRSTFISDALADAARRWSELEIVVVTNQGYANDWLAGGWCRECYERIQRRRDSFELYALKSYAEDARGHAHLEDVDNHAKLMIVDDLYMTVGSCNINDRGFEYEGEINVAVVDPALVAAARLRIWRDLLADDPGLTGDIQGDCEVWRKRARANDAYLKTGQGMPTSQIFPFTPKKGRPILSASDVF